jgi:hypothetical protein
MVVGGAAVSGDPAAELTNGETRWDQVKKLSTKKLFARNL